MVNGWRSDRGGDGSDGDQEPDGPGDGEAVLFDSADASGEDTEWWPGPDHTRAIRDAKAGERAVWRMLRGVSQRGTWVRTKAWASRDGEPVTRVDLHPDGWLELEARMRDLEARAVKAERILRLLAQRGVQLEGDGGKESGRSSLRRCTRSLVATAMTWGVALAAH